MVNLTKRTVEALRPREREYWAWDERLPGFGVRVKPSGVVSYVLQYRNKNGRTRKLTLGRHGVLTSEQAREHARSTLAEISRGRDPAAERVEQRRASTVAELCDQYLELHAKLHKRSWKDDQQRIRAYIKPRLGRLIA